jgi:hypothetical protein
VQVVPFSQRVSVLHSLLEHDRDAYYRAQGPGGIMAQLGLGLGGGAAAGAGNGPVEVHVNRGKFMVRDAFTILQPLAPHRLKGKIRIQFISEQGIPEDGIDGGGLFKEFMDSFAKVAFHPSYGLFLPTTHQLLTPNPDSGEFMHEHIEYFNFLGKVLGKAVYEVCNH